MKKITASLFVLALLILVSCKDNKQGIEILPNDDIQYKTISQVDKGAELDSVKTKDTGALENDGFKLFDDLATKLNKDITLDSANQPVIYKFAYELFIDENGDIKKIKELDPSEFKCFVDALGAKVYNNYGKLSEGFLSICEKLKFIPAKKNDLPVKFRMNLVLGVKLAAGEKIGHEINLNLHMPKFSSFDFNLHNRKMPKDFNPSSYFVQVQEMPSIIGGIEALQKNIYYPDPLRKAGIEGRVFLKAFINEQGEVVYTEVMKGVNEGLDTVAQNAVMKTKFIPGKQNGKPVKTQVSIPIVFKLR